MAADRSKGVKIRVLEVLATLKRAGAEVMAVSLARRLEPARFETAVVSLYDAFPGGLEPELAATGIRTWHLGKRPGFDPRMIRGLRRVIREFRPEVIHSHSYVLRYSLPAAFGLGRPAMAHTVHNLAARESDLFGRLLHRWAFGRRVAAVAVGEEVRRSFEEWYGRPPAATIRNGIETALAAPDARARWRAAHGFHEDDVLIVSAGRLDPQKNPVGLIDAFGVVSAVEPRAHLLLAGDGSLRSTAEAAAGERVRFLGVRGDVADILAASDMFALASDWEGTPLAVMEAMAAGLPVAATAVGGVPELAADGAGVLVEAGDMAGLGNALLDLARDPDRRRALGAVARKRAESFSARAMVDAYAALFVRLAGGAR